MAPPILSSNRSKSCSTIRLGVPVRTMFFFPAVGEVTLRIFVADAFTPDHFRVEAERLRIEGLDLRRENAAWRPPSGT